MNNRSFLRSFAHFFSGTFLSRLLGMVREIGMAVFFGTHPLTAAFFIAFRFANLFRRIFGESALLSGFIPFFEKIQKNEEQKGLLFFKEVFFSLSFILLLLCTGLEILLYAIKGGFSLENQEIIRLTMIMLPGVIFICLYGLFGAFLQCKKHFFLSSFASAGFNIAWIGAIFYFRKFSMANAMIGLSFAISFGFFLQWLLVGMKSFSLCRGKISWKTLPSTLFSLNVRQMMKAVAYSAIGVGATQINTAMDFIFARFSSLQGPAFLSYAIRLEQLPLALIAIGISSVILPLLSKSSSQERTSSYLQSGFSYIFALLIPCTFGIWLFGTSGINLIYGHGKFDSLSIIQTSYCLWGYGLSLVFAAMAMIFSSSFYAQKDFKTPMRGSIYTMACNLILNSAFIILLHLPVASVAYATSLSAAFNALYLYSKWKKQNLFSLKQNQLDLYKVLFTSAVATAITFAISRTSLLELSLFSSLFNLPFTFSNSLMQQLEHFAVLSFSFFGTYAIVGKMLRIQAIEQIWSYKKLPINEQ